MLRTSAVSLFVAAIGGMTAYWSTSREVVENALVIMCLALVVAVMFILLSLSEDELRRERTRGAKPPARPPAPRDRRRNPTRT